jgi:L-asparaginase/Glu-tRNA(Gln) amidotransferase subunit D
MTVRIKSTSLLIIYTGGTIGMVRHPVTGVLRPFPFENIELNVDFLTSQVSLRDLMKSFTP